MIHFLINKSVFRCLFQVCFLKPLSISYCVNYIGFELCCVCVSLSQTHCQIFQVTYMILIKYISVPFSPQSLLIQLYIFNMKEKQFDLPDICLLFIELCFIMSLFPFYKIHCFNFLPTSGYIIGIFQYILPFISQFKVMSIF